MHDATGTSLVSEALIELEERVRKRFVYKNDTNYNLLDKRVLDEWRSHGQKFLDDPNYIIRDDCDSLTATVQELLIIEHGVPLHDLWRCLVASPQSQNGSIDHMIGLVKTADKGIMYCGDTFGPAKEVIHVPHKIIEVQNLEDLVWRRWI